MNNSVFGKSMENVKNRKGNIEMVFNKERYDKILRSM